MLFDHRAARALAVGDHLTVSDAPGLRLVRSGAGLAWIYRYKSPVDGRMRQIKLGAWPYMPAGAAWQAWDVVRAERDAGRDLAVERRAERRQAAAAHAMPATVGDLIDAWLEVVAARLKPKGAREVRRLLAAGAYTEPVRHLAPADVTRSVAFGQSSTRGPAGSRLTTNGTLAPLESR